MNVGFFCDRLGELVKVAFVMDVLVVLSLLVFEVVLVCLFGVVWDGFW